MLFSLILLTLVLKIELTVLFSSWHTTIILWSTIFILFCFLFISPLTLFPIHLLPTISHLSGVKQKQINGIFLMKSLQYNSFSPPLFFNFLIYYLKSIYPCEAMRYSPIFPELLRGALFYANTTINRNLNVVKHIDSEVSLQVEVQLYHLTQII